MRPKTRHPGVFRVGETEYDIDKPVGTLFGPEPDLQVGLSGPEWPHSANLLLAVTAARDSASGGFQGRGDRI